MKKTILFLLMSLIFVLSACDSKKQAEKRDAVQTESSLNSSEYKLLLNPKMFDNYVEGFEAYWKIIREVAAEEKIAVLVSEHPLKLKQKQVSFFDTEKLDLRKEGFLLRVRTKYKKGKASPGNEYTIKYQRPGAQEALAVDLTLGEGYLPKDDEIELESDIVYFSKVNGAEQITYSLSNATIIDANPEMTVSAFSNIFPVLGKLSIPVSTELIKVAELSAVEWKVSPGILEFGHGLNAEMDITVWILESENGPVNIPEFSFDHGYNKDSQWNKDSMDKCRNFMKKLHEANAEWIIPGSGKSAKLFEMQESQKIDF